MPAGVRGFISFHIERSEIFHNAGHYFTFCGAKYFTQNKIEQNPKRILLDLIFTSRKV